MPTAEEINDLLLTCASDTATSVLSMAQAVSDAETAALSCQAAADCLAELPEGTEGTESRSTEDPRVAELRASQKRFELVAAKGRRFLIGMTPAGE